MRVVSNETKRERQEGENAREIENKKIESKDKGKINEKVGTLETMCIIFTVNKHINII